MKTKRVTKKSAGRPLAGAERKQRHMIMLEPSVAAMLRALGGENLSHGIALAAEAHKYLNGRAAKAGR